MNQRDRNNRPPFEEIVIRSVKQLEIDPKKTPRKILPRTTSEDKIEDKFFLLKGKQKLFAQKSFFKKIQRGRETPSGDIIVSDSLTFFQP